VKCTNQEKKVGGECILSQIGSWVHHKLTQPKYKRGHHSPPYGTLYDSWKRLYWNNKKTQEGVF
jgi:hypothetical protein